MKITNSSRLKRIKEEIGRNYSTRSLGDKPYSMMDNTNVDVNMFAMNDGKWSAEVKCISNPDLSTYQRIFSDEASANHWARTQVDLITRKTMNESRIRRMVYRVIKQIYLG
tara:strand:+ start:3753 stop:4085 length:333 start_codon:yes stop_codon:yes gene_type:complete